MSKLHYRSFFSIGESLYLLNISWFLTFLIFINQKLFLIRNFFNQLRYLAYRFVIYISISSFLIVVFNLDDLSRSMFLGSTIIFFVLKFLVSFPFKHLISKRRKGQYYSKILVAGAGTLGKTVMSFYDQNKDLGRVVGFLSNRENNINCTPVLGNTTEFQEVFEKNPVNELIITLPMTKREEIKDLIKLAEYNGVRPRIVADYREMFNRQYEASNLGSLPVVNIREVPLSIYSNRFWKRAFDLVFSSLMLLFHFPLLVIIAAAIKIESRGPIFYKPIRGGRGGTTFTLYKFRSMKVNDDPITGELSTRINDPRISKVGRVIRKLNLDELPQFFNVLKNEMSVVGPRPHRIKLNESFRKNVPHYMVRYYIKPGITGWAQVNGWRGPAETGHQRKARTLHDLWYVENWNFWLDLYIIVLTLFNRKAYKNNA